MLSVLIPARNEFLLRPTIESVLEAARGEIEVIAVLDGYWPEPNIIDDPRVTLIHHTEPIGQRAATNEAARIARGKYILKTDAHSMFDEGFDVKLAEDCEYDWTVLPRMYNLHAFDHVCENGHRFYQDKFDHKKENVCPDCNKALKVEMVWKPRKHRKTDYMNFGSDMVVKYWKEYKKRPEAKGDITDVMNGVGACWFLHKDRYWELGGLDEKHGSWGQMGVEVALKAWLSGGRHVVNKKTWFAHMFRTTGEFGFPYDISGKSQDKARKYSRKLWQNNNWPQQKRDFQWVLDKFAPIPTWEDVKKPLASVIIPARNEKYLQRTIDDCLAKIKCDFEIVVGADGYLPELKEDPRVVLCHSKERIGMRPMINKMARMARGKYLMRLDAHCIVDEGICEKLIACHEKGSLVLAMRYELRSKDWTRRDRTDCPYRYLSHPEVDPKGGLRGLAWPEYAAKRKDYNIDETMTISGSNWLVEKEQFWNWGGMDEEYGIFGQEGVEISCMTWLSGGRVLVNKDTWYAHWNRGKSSYALGSGQKPKSMARSMDVWLNDKWPHATRKFQWLVDKFDPPGWNRFYVHPYNFKTRTRDVDKLYANFREHYHPKKIAKDNPRGYDQFIKTFVPFIESILGGATYSDAESRELPYYKYLIKHLNKRYKYSHPELPARSHRYLTKKMRDAEALTKNIKKTGLNTPIDMVRWEGKDVIIKGCRRLVILHLLGVEKVIARMFTDMDSFERMDKVLSARSGGPIEKAAISQYIIHGKDSTDKYYKHNYTHLYDRYIRKPKKILEIGVKHGASLDMWQRAFPKVKVFGIDIDDVSNRRFAKDCEVFTGNQNDRPFLRTVGKHYDLIVDDGSHRVKDIIISLEELWPKLKPGGWYAIEDIFMTGKGRKNIGKTQKLMDKIKSMSDEICFTKTVRTVAFHLNICFIQKN